MLSSSNLAWGRSIHDGFYVRIIVAHMIFNEYFIKYIFIYMFSKILSDLILIKIAKTYWLMEEI